MKNVHESKFTREAPVFERMCDVEVSVIPSEVVPHPTSVIVDVRSVGMTFHIPVSLFGHRVRSVLLRARGTVRRDVPATGAARMLANRRWSPLCPECVDASKPCWT